ncbi:hypothetical protein [Bradyrhizobium sp. 143]|uniref:hypothetical protein n=1 Tax=Bradyrhizobium sp. 143 TaxID=2782619 RepID=UPI001FF7703E|nr:hypothetical protein [Bradyrhizobium sp. 143]MCK1709592.1 hypothetical protein [Bradyrhizobium sp. 143]
MATAARASTIKKSDRDGLEGVQGEIAFARRDRYEKAPEQQKSFQLYSALAV